jgi:hypothetical protein
VRSRDTNIPVQAGKGCKLLSLLSTPVIPMIALGASFLGLSQGAFAGGQASTRNPAITCAQLGGIKLKDVGSITAQPVAAGTFTPPGSMALNNLPAFCRVSLMIKPQINIEVWLPMDWNERFQAVGGGGYAGSISWAALAGAIRNGYGGSSDNKNR